MKPIMKCLILGFGYMGQIRYQALKKQHPVEILIKDDAKYGTIPGVDKYFLAPGEPIPWHDVDAVLVCTPNNVTADLCIEALRRRKHVFCEKPPARNWEEFCRIAEAAAEVPNHTLVFGFNHRLHPSIQAAQALIGRGGLGDVLYVKGTYGKSGGLNFRQSWRNQKNISGGGILIDQGIHMLDLFCLFLGPLNVVSSVLTNAFWGYEDVEDNAFVLLRSESGIPAQLHSSATLWKHTFRLEIGCRDGYLVASGLLSKTGSYGREQLVIGRRQFEDEAMALGNPREEIIYFDRDESWDKELEEFFTAIREGRPATHGTLDEAARVMQIVRDVYAAARRTPMEVQS